MEQETRRRRLDEILIEEGLVSEVQVKDALMRQKAHGGKFGSQLLYHRYIDEAGLVKALSKQFGCPGVVLANLQIPQILLRTISKKIALARKVIPFDYDVENNILKIACEDPTDQNLINELNFVTRGKAVQLYVAAEIALNTAIARHYLGVEISLEDNLLLEIPDAATATDKIMVAAEKTLPTADVDLRPAILLATDEVYAAPVLQALLERENYQVVVADSLDNAISQLSLRSFHVILVKETICPDMTAFADKVRKISPRTTIRFYDAPSSLLLKNEAFATVADLGLKNLELFTSLLSNKAALPVNHSGRVGQYADRLCRRLSLPETDRLVITTAAYIHDLARFYYGMNPEDNDHSVIQLTVKLLASLGYSPVIQEILEKMYVTLPTDSSQHLTLPVLGGNVLTIADMFCDSSPHHDRLSLDRFDILKRQFRDMTGRLILADVIEAFIDMIQEEILDQHTTSKTGQIMIYAEELAKRQLLELRLKNEGFRTVSHYTVHESVEMCKRSEPDLMILMVPGPPEQSRTLISSIKAGGVDTARIPTFLLTESGSISQLTGLLEEGVEDIIALDDNLDMLVTKIRKHQARLGNQQGVNDVNGGGNGARGRLADMNLIDLVQALGPGRKTVRITVQSTKPDARPLYIFMNQGAIVHAKCGTIAGPEAIYEGLTWADGTWTIEPATPDLIPQQNNWLSNEGILMEGCRLLDEKIRSGQAL
jgi:DNA-binding response OmpR family regulator